MEWIWSIQAADPHFLTFFFYLAIGFRIYTIYQHEIIILLSIGRCPMLLLLLL